MNIHDIAREAGVSIATVSRVLNASPVVGEPTRSRVQAVIDAHAYTPNALARGLLENRTRTIGVLTVDILNPYYATVVHGIEREMSKRGSSTLLCETGGLEAEKQRYIKTLLEKRVDCLVFVGSVYRAALGNEDILTAARSVPVVMINSTIKADNVHCILCDDVRGIQQALDFLAENGRRRIIFICTTETASARTKREAYFDELMVKGWAERHGGSIEIELEDLSDLPRRLSVLWAESPFDAVLATDDLFANVAVNSLHSLGVSIPREVWILGYNNSYVSEQTYPRLSSVDSRMEDLARACADIVIQALTGEGQSSSITVLEPRLALKDSTDWRGGFPEIGLRGLTNPIATG